MSAGRLSAGRNASALARAWRAALACVLLTIAALATCSASASALTARGHVFCASCSFGSLGAGPGQFSKPSAVAVNEKTGEVYVADLGNKRVERFTTTGTKGEQPKFVSEFVGGKVKNPQAIAVDNSGSAEDPSAGDVYVVDTNGVEKFNAQGIFIRNLTSHAEKEEFERPLGVAVGTGGVVWVYWSSAAIVKFDDSEVNQRVTLKVGEEEVESIESESSEARPGFAVDSNENLYVGHEPSSTFAEEPHEEPCEKAPCFVAELDRAGTTLLEELDRENTSAVAVDLTNNNVYVDNVTSVAEFSSNHTLIQRFGSGILQHGSGVAVDSATEDVFVADAAAARVDVFEPEPPGAPTIDSLSSLNVTAESADLRASIDPTGSETTFSFQYGTAAPLSCPNPVSPPCEGEAPIPAASVGSSYGDQVASLHLGGLRAGTTYNYRVRATNGLGSVTSHEGTFTTPPNAGQLALPDARLWELVSPPDKHGAGIEPIRGRGAAIQASTDGAAITYAADAPVGAHPDGNRNPDVAQVLSVRMPGEWSSQELTTPNDRAQGVFAQEAPEYLLFSPNLSLGLVAPLGGAATGVLAEPPLSPPAAPGETQERTIYLRIDSPLSPEASQAPVYLAAKRNGETMGNAGYLALVTAANDTASPKAPFGNQLKFLGATPDMTHVVFESKVALTSPAPAGAALYEWSGGTLQLISRLPDGTPTLGTELGGENKSVRHAISDDGSRIFFEVNSGSTRHLYMRDMTKGRTVQLDAVQGGTGEGRAVPVFQTASANGAKVYFTDSQRLSAGSGGEEGAPDLYECEIGEAGGEPGCSLSDLTPVTSTGEIAAVRGTGLSASDDGSRVYFVANGVLSANKNARGDAASPGDCITIADTQNIPPPGATCNLYVRAPEPQHAGLYTTTFIASLSNEDSPDWEGNKALDLGRVTSRVSPNGGYLAFMSNRSLTGYDNTDTSSQVGEPRADEEVFLYNAQSKSLSESLICASCNPSGARPAGVLDTEHSGEGEGLLVDNRGIWRNLGRDRWLAGSVPGWTSIDPNHALYQSRYLSDHGRLFFNSADALVTQDTNRKEDVYQYEPQGVGGEHGCAGSSTNFAVASGGCVTLISSGKSTKESAFLDASEGGGDAFFLTAEALLPQQDADTSFDVYDAHECTSQAPCRPPVASTPVSPCASEACRPPSGPQPSSGAPASSAFSGAGNLAAAVQGTLGDKKVQPTRAQRLVRALKACKRLKSSRQRAACRRRAEKRYGARGSKRSKHISHGNGR